MTFDTQRIISLLLRMMGAVSLLLGAISPIFGVPAWATNEYVSLTGQGMSNSKQTSSIPSNFSTYKSDQLSVRYPDDWQVTFQDEYGVALVSAQDTIRTDIVLVRENPDVLVPQRLEQIVSEAVAVRRYSLVTIDGQSGFRMWYESDANQWTLVTFIGYEDQQTVVLTSEYVPDVNIEAVAMAVHDSFINRASAESN
ncbi:MAG: hypothetical protein AAF821_01095 [Cyanobacteria bacterium P01_D01_bin.156]